MSEIQGSEHCIQNRVIINVDNNIMTINNNIHNKSDYFGTTIVMT